MSIISPRSVKTSEHNLFDNNISKESYSDFIRVGEQKRKTCCSAQALPKQASLFNLVQSDNPDDEEYAFEGNMEEVSMNNEISSKRINDNMTFKKEGSCLTDFIKDKAEDVLSNQIIGLQSRKDILPSLIQHSHATIMDNLRDSDKLKIKERQSIISNSKYEKYMASNVDQKQIKFKSLSQVLNLVVIVSNFIQQIKKLGQQYKFKRLKQADFQIIGDKSSHYQYYFEKQFFYEDVPSFAQRIFLKLMLLIDKAPILSNLKKKIVNEIDWRATIITPNQPIKIFWDSFIFFLLSMNIFYVPIKITWEGTGQGGLILSQWVKIFLNDLPGWAFLGDIVLNFNTAFYKQGAIICQRKKIVKYYLKTKFLSDLIVVIPFILSLKLNLTLLNAILLLRTNKMFKMAEYFEQLVNFRKRQAALYNLCKLIFMIVFVAHFCGCMFFLVGSTEQSYQLFDKTWIDVAGISDSEWIEQYITSLYWAVITMITIGYGDIVPITVYERIFVILITLISCGVFAYSVNQIGSLVQTLTNNKNQMQQKMGILARHLRNRGVSQYLQMQVRKYFEYQHQKDESEGELCDMMIESLSIHLRQEVQNDIRYRLINQMELLKNNFSAPFLKSVAHHIKIKRSKPEEILIEEQQINDKLFFLVQGTVNASINIVRDNSVTSRSLVKQIKSRSLFDQVSFIGDLRSLTSYITNGSCTLYFIFKEDFLKEINNFPLDKEKYQLIKDNITIYRSQRNIGTKCSFCDQHSHSFDLCPYIKYIPYKEKHLALHRATIDQERCTHKRKQYIYQALRNHNLSKESAVNYLIENNPYKNEEDLIERLELLNDLEFEGDHIKAQNFISSKETGEQSQEKSELSEVTEAQDEANENNDNQKSSEAAAYSTQKPSDQNSDSPLVPQQQKLFQNNALKYLSEDQDIQASQKVSTSVPNIPFSFLEQQQQQVINNSVGIGSIGTPNAQHSSVNQQQQQQSFLKSQSQSSLKNQQQFQQVFSVSQLVSMNLEGELDPLFDNPASSLNQLNTQQPLNQPKKKFSNPNKKLLRSPSKKKAEEQLGQIKLRSKDSQQSLHSTSSHNKQHTLLPLNLKRVEESNPSENYNHENVTFQNQMSIDSFPFNITYSQTKKKGIGEEQDKKSNLHYLKKGIELKRMSYSIANALNNPLNTTINNTMNNSNQMHSQQETDVQQAQQNISPHLNYINSNNLLNPAGNSFNSSSIPMSIPPFRRNSNVSLLQSSPTNQLFPHYLQSIDKFQISIPQQLYQGFMPLLDFERMMNYSVYYPLGNYQNVILRYKKNIQKKLNIIRPENYKLKKSVNKILQIRQLQNMILKKSNNHHTQRTPSNNAIHRKSTEEIKKVEQNN